MQASFDYQAFGIGVKRVREIRELTLREFSCLAEVNKETIRRVESGVPCSDRTREKIRRTLNTSLQRLCLLSRSDESKISIHRADATNWIISKDRRPYAKNADSDINPPIYVESNLIQNCSERNRLGNLGFATRFLKLFDCDRQGGRVFAGLMEVYDRGDAKSHPGEEFIYCIRGDIRLLLNETEHILTEGCAITFDARLPHDYEPLHNLKPGELPPLVLYASINLPRSSMPSAEKMEREPSSKCKCQMAEFENAPVMTTLNNSPGLDDFDYKAFGQGVYRLRRVRGLSVRLLAQQAGVNKDTVRIVEAGKPCSERTRAKLQAALRTSIQRLCIPVSRSNETLAIYHPGETKWIISQDRRRLPKRKALDGLPHAFVDGPSIQDEQERSRLGRLGFASRFMLPFSCDLVWSPVFTGLLEVFDGNDPQAHPGEEFVYCLRGGVKLHLDGEQHELQEGDAATFDARLLHDYEALTPVARGQKAPLLLYVRVDV